MARWTPFPYDASAYRLDAATLAERWRRLHAGDAEPWPDDDAVRDAWLLFHAGEFERAVEAGLAAGGAGITVANKAQATHAQHLEPSEATRLALFLQVAERAETQIAARPDDANAHYWMAQALGRAAQGTRIAKALAQGLGSRVKSALEAAIRLEPRHADAHVALGAFHAQVIDQVGSLLGRTQGASKDAGLIMFRTALRLNPASAAARVAYANGMVMLEGDKTIADATRLYEAAAAIEPLDAAERLDVEMAKAELRG